MTINDYGLPKEVINEAIAYIENDKTTQTFLRKMMSKPTNMLTKLSPRMVLNIELDTEVKIEEANLSYEEDKAKRKKYALIAFFALHPWLIVNSQKPRESITEWLLLYKEIAQIKEGQSNAGKSVIIRGDGTIEIE